MSESTLAQIRKIRLEKINLLRKLGINPYPSKGRKDFLNKEIVENFPKYEGKKVSLVGRIMSWREHGHIVFAHIQDESGRIQLYVKDEVLEKTSKEKQTLGFSDLGLLDVGDFIEANGEITKTQRGEISILPSQIKLLSKTLRPLPEKWHGITDVEERFRRRYLDMTMNPEVRERFERRSKFWQATRAFLNKNGFIEVNIPVLEHVTGGADAKPFITHFDALDQDLYLRISHELPLKRLIGGGFEKVYDIGARFRNEGFSDEHLPEHVAIEWYWAYADFRDGMKLTQEMFKYVMKEVYGKLNFEIRGFQIDLDKEWEILDFVNLMSKRFKIDIFKDPVEKMNSVLKKEGVDLGKDINRNRVVDNLWKLIRKDIGGPAFLLGVPKFLSPLSKSNAENSNIVDRFQPIIAGSELANAWSELNDPVDQLERFVDQQKLREAGDDEAQMMDIDYVEMLEYGMPPAVGYGHSERVFWFFENVTAKEGVPFPSLKSELEDTTREIYKDIEKYIDNSTLVRAKNESIKKPKK
ncbi:lysine--tRNA ligase [Candidatus Dojkabacteria bacterium]|nr:lysine--tRNA ligase [Candidatus Dojkabacteria bacterium]